MQRHVSFWLGVFITLVLLVPLAFGIIGASEERILNHLVFGFGVLTTLLVILLIFIFYREKIVSKIFNSTVGTIDEVAGSVQSVVNSVINRDSEQATHHSIEVAKKMATLYSWASFYKWVVGTALGLLVCFAGFAGTLLLFQQNKKLGEQTVQLENQNKTSSDQYELFQLQTDLLKAQNNSIDAQNDLSSLNLTDNIRALLAGDSDYYSDKAFNVKHNICPFSVPKNQNSYFELPNKSKLKQLENMTDSKAWGERLVESLQVLLTDDNPSVSIGALMVLESINADLIEDEIFLKNVHLAGINISNEITIYIEDSVIRNFSCAKCDVQISNSFVDGLDSHSGGMVNTISMFRNNDKNEIGSSESIFIVDSNRFRPGVELSAYISKYFSTVAPYQDVSNRLVGIRSDGSAYIKKTVFEGAGEIGAENGCDFVAKFCQKNNVISCTDP